MSKKKDVKFVERELFVRIRYKNFLLNKSILDQLDPDRILTHLTDLDSNYGGSKNLSDVVLCDGCNEDIEEPFFIMVEEQRCYHDKCLPAFDRQYLQTNNVVALK